MATAVAGKKCHSLAFKRADDEVIRRFAERRVNRYLVRVRQSCHLVETTAANNANRNFFQGSSRKVT